MSVAATLLSSARRYRGVSGRALARQTSSSQAGLVGVENGTSDATTERLDRILRALDYQIVALPTRLGTACDAGEDIRRYDWSAKRPCATRTGQTPKICHGAPTPPDNGPVPCGSRSKPVPPRTASRLCRVCARGSLTANASLP